MKGRKMYVTGYLVVISYFTLAAISPQATVIPNTWHELARVGVLCVIAAACYKWGALSNHTLIVLKPKQDHPTEGLHDQP